MLSVLTTKHKQTKEQQRKKFKIKTVIKIQKIKKRCLETGEQEGDVRKLLNS
jgi:ribosomal protein S14